MTASKRSPRQRLISLARRGGVVRPRDLDRYGIPRTYLQRLVREGVFERVARGVYALTDRRATEHATLVEVAKRIPGGVVCLLSALQFHRLGTQLPWEVWLAIDRKAWRPRVTDLPVRIVRFSGSALTEGIEVHRIEGTKVRVYCPAKTVADCFKYRNKIGLDVALEALRDCRDSDVCAMEDLSRFTRICRVSRVMRPYLEAMG